MVSACQGLASDCKKHKLPPASDPLAAAGRRVFAIGKFTPEVKGKAHLSNVVKCHDSGFVLQSLVSQSNGRRLDQFLLVLHLNYLI
jgi:hypothetical protein